MDLVWPATAWALWVATLAAAFKLSSRGRVPGLPERYEVPAPVAELLRGMRSQEVFHSTLSELAGRGQVSIEGDRLSLTGAGGEPLAAYERWVLERVTDRLAGAPYARVVALMPEGRDLDGGFVPLVRQCAIDLGLARRRWPSLIVPVLLAAGLVVPWYATVSAAGLSWPGMIATMVSFVAGVGLLMGGRGFLLTARGREVARSGPAPVRPEQEWIFTGSGWHGVEIEAAGPVPEGPKRQEVTGHVVKRWVAAGPGGAGAPEFHIALHDGSSEQATAFLVDQGVYQDVLPGDSVRLLFRPRNGTVVRVLAHERHW
ncbi:DUF2207 domain-containing protein [Nonomuraea zeae]|uniref:DUF2207 domain-containing protein n=1 Tax=Nonomuraea zeae TaxID=1642303 RepID=A0A5S4G381_9ACTN|nr:DUF2207 domain-containing protein [Nonomuraea zeae]TMR27302.1 DUF2207 domain-containing protein [Nonomuraea zeae]